MAVLNLYSKTWIIRLLDHQFAISMVISHQSSLLRSPIQPGFYLPDLQYFLLRDFNIFSIAFALHCYCFVHFNVFLHSIFYLPWLLSRPVLQHGTKWFLELKRFSLRFSFDGYIFPQTGSIISTIQPVFYLPVVKYFLFQNFSIFSICAPQISSD